MQKIYNSKHLDVVLIIVSLYSIFFIFHKFIGGKIPFWDFHITYCAAKNFFLGNFPYGLNVHENCLDPNITLSVNYSPGTLELIKYFGLINISFANFLWIFFEILSLLTIFYVLKKIYKFNYEWRNFLIFFFSFGGSIFISFISGNVSVILCGLLALGIFFLYKKFFNYYYLIVIFVSFFKFYYLSFLLIPFFLLGFKSLKKIFFSIILFIFVQYLFYINNPELTLAFLDVIQGKYGDVLPIRMQTGTGLYSIIEKMPAMIFESKSLIVSFSSLKINLLIWFILNLIILLSVFYCLHSKTIVTSKAYFLYCISFGILSINLIIPRLVAYDLILTIPVFFYLLNQINYEKLKINKFNIKYFFVFLFFVFFDHHFPFFMTIMFLTFFIYSEFYKKNYFIY